MLQNAPISPGAPTLVVRNLSRVASYYEKQIGLERIDLDSDGAHLGAGASLNHLIQREPDKDISSRM